MDTQNSVMLMIGSITYITTIFIEAYMETNTIIPPCVTKMKFTAYNFIFIAFPMALILSAELNLMQKAGALGLTSILETFCVLGITGFEKMKGLHVPFCITAGICHTLVAFNLVFWYGLFAGVPLLLSSLVYIILNLRYKEETYFEYLISIVLWGQDVWIALSRTALICIVPSNWVNHYWFDVISSSSSFFIFSVLCVWALSTANMPNDHWMKKIFY
jgi:hypothetical protein